MPTLSDIPLVIEHIANAKTIVITGHQYPDGDAVGSALALQGILKNIGKEVTTLLPKAQIGTPSVLEGFDSIVDTDDYDYTLTPDLFICVDCAEISRICDKRLQGWVRTLPTINIDHHGKELFGTLNYVIPDYSCTGEMIYDLANTAGWTIPFCSAEAIWVSLITDTLNFSKPATRASTFRCAAKLLESGVRAPYLCDAIRQESSNVMELRKRAMNSLEFWENGKVAVISLTREDFTETGCVKKDTEDFPSIPLMVKGHKIALFVYPLIPSENQEIRISIRSKSDSPISAKKIATHFGGAGHEDSAGATYIGSVEKAKSLLRQYISSFF